VGAGVVALGIAGSAVPAVAGTVTDLITFTVSGSSGVNAYPNPPSTPDDLLHLYQAGATATGSFDITYDPSQNYLLPQLISNGVITNLTYSVTDPYFSSSPLLFSSSPLVGNPISQFQIAYGFLDLYSDPGVVTPVGSPDITFSINLSNGFTAVYYAQTGYDDTLTMNGPGSVSSRSVSAAATPLPSTWTMLIAGFVGLLGFVAFGGKKRKVAAIAAA
jgi:hypothetical protein